MKLPSLQRRTLALIAVIVPLLLLFVYVALRSGPLAPVAVTLTTVQSRAVAPALAGIGTVQVRYLYKIGPAVAGRLQRLDVHVGDRVRAGQLLGEMDAVDLDERMRAAQAAILSAEAGLRQAQARQIFAQSQARRYEQLVSVRVSSEESYATRQQELAVADAALAGAREDASRLRAELQALRAQRGNLRLLAPVAGLVAARDADPGTTVVAGQAVVRLIDPASLWVDARFDQISAQGLAAGLPAEVALRSRPGQPLAARVLRTEPLADAVTEELLAKIVFDALPEPLPALPESPTIPNAALRTVAGQRGVWKITDGALAFAPVRLGRADLDGQVQVLDGLAVGDSIVLYSEKALTTKSRVHVVERIAGVAP